MFSRKLPSYFSFVVSAYVLHVLVSFILRVVFLLATYSQANALPQQGLIDLVGWAFFMGWRYDTIVATYCLIVPFILFAIGQFWYRLSLIFNTAALLLYIILCTATLLVAAADIPYFNYYDTRVSVSIFQWLDSGITSFLVIFQEPAYLSSVILFIISTGLSIAASLYIYKRTVRTRVHSEFPGMSKTTHVLLLTLMLALLFHGLKANFKSPLRMNDAMQTQYSYINQLALNPSFSLVKTYSLNKKTSFMDDDVAIKNTRRFLNITDTCFSSPLSRLEHVEPNTSTPNIVLVFLESMTTANMKFFGCKNTITPFLDSLTSRSIFFTNIYSTGIHTHNAIFSTLWAYPTLCHTRQMSANTTNKFTGFPGILKARGYKNYFLITHDKEFDNIHGFVLKNDFDTIISKENYDPTQSVGVFGVPDHVMFRKGIDEMTRCNETGKKFFMTFLTTSNHPPFVLPADIPFKPRSSCMANKMIEYADWAISDFLKRAASHQWFDSTLFVFVGDHGQIRYFNAYDMPLTYNQVPLYIYAPKILKSNKIVNTFGSQCDIFPTVMSLLGIPFVNNTPGVNLLAKKKQCTLFTTEYKIGCIDSTYFYVYRENGPSSLYKYRTNSTIDYIDSLPSVADSLRLYALSILQASQLNIKNNKTGSDHCH